MKSIRLKIHGKVQGVFFRQHTLEKARALGLKGTVRNCADGTVEIEVEGPEEMLADFISWCNEGPSRAEVLKVDMHDLPLKNFNEFRILK